MLDYLCLGSVPPKHHIAHRDDKGGLFWEECLTRNGFDGPYSILYHQHRPHEHLFSETSHGWPAPIEAPNQRLAKRHFKSQEMTPSGGAAIDCRVPLLFNSDLIINILHPDEADPVYLSNADADELFYIFKGTGTMRSIMGDLRYKEDDYVFIPKGVLHRFIPDEDSPQYWLNIECIHGLNLLKQWRTSTGQLSMDAPYCHRDFQRPTFRGPIDEGIRQVVVKRKKQFHGFTMPNNPLDVVGWDGSVYPWIFPMLNFQPRAGLVHLPPTWHGTFATNDALICSFVPRTVDFHPDSIPCPYPHSSVDCDEFLFYCRGNFTSRKGVGPGSISYHPMGIPHGPHPGAYEASQGHRTTNEMAVMIDTFKEMKIALYALEIEDIHYQESFLAKP